jgi:hypothetical protein
MLMNPNLNLNKSGIKSIHNDCYDLCNGGWLQWNVVKILCKGMPKFFMLHKVRSMVNTWIDDLQKLDISDFVRGSQILDNLVVVVQAHGSFSFNR